MCFPTETFAWRVVEAVADHLDVVIAHRAGSQRRARREHQSTRQTLAAG